jgi:transcriptional regulator with XRE-family HTH domain
MENIDERVGKRIEGYRKLRDLSRADLGEALGRTRQTIFNWEQGTTSLRLGELVEVAEALEVPLPEFLAVVFREVVPVGQMTAFAERRREVSSQYARDIAGFIRGAKSNLDSFAELMGQGLDDIAILASAWADQRPRTAEIWEEPAASRSKPKPRKKSASKRAGGRKR